MTRDLDRRLVRLEGLRCTPAEEVELDREIERLIADLEREQGWEAVEAVLAQLER